MTQRYLMSALDRRSEDEDEHYQSRGSVAYNRKNQSRRLEIEDDIESEGNDDDNRSDVSSSRGRRAGGGARRGGSDDGDDDGFDSGSDGAYADDHQDANNNNNNNANGQNGKSAPKFKDKIIGPPSTLRDREHHKEVILMWGDNQIDATLKHFKCVRYRFMQNGRLKEMTQFFAHPNSDDHLREYRATFRVKYEDTEGIPLKFLFETSKHYLSDVMEAYISSKNSNETPAGIVTDNTMMIHSLFVTNVISTLQTPLSVTVDGITDKFTVPHYKSWEATTSLAVLTPGMRGDSIFEYDLTSSPNLHAIHGIHNIEADEKKGIASWGAVRGDHVAVDMCSGRFAWLMWNLPYLIKDYLSRNKDRTTSIEKRLPQGLSKEVWSDVKEFMKKYPLPPIYSRKANLKDDYIGKLMRLLNPSEYDSESKKKQLLWAVLQDMACYRIPKEFMEYVVKRYKETTVTVKMVRPEKMVMHTSASTMEGEDRFRPNDIMTFTVSALGFTPRMYYRVSIVKTAEDNYDD